MKLFAKGNVNTGRQVEADIAKTVCIIGMVFVHCFETINCNVTAVSTAEYIVVTVLDCIFGAGTFMFCMGFGIAYSRHSKPEYLIRRGASILLFGLILNILRGVLPLLVALRVTKDASLWKTILVELVNLDILPFAGLALMLFGILQKLRLKPLGILAVAGVLSVIGSFFRSFDLGGLLPNQLVGLFLGTYSPDYGEETLAYFPLFNWFIFVAAGYCFALLMRRCTDKKRLYAIASPIAGAVVLVYMLVAVPNRLGMLSGDFNKYYHMTILEAIICTCAAVAVLGMYYALSRVLPGFVLRFTAVTSRNINRIYCIHWVVLGWIWFIAYYICGVEEPGDARIFAFGVVLFILASTVAELYVGFKESRRAKRLSASAAE